MTNTTNTKQDAPRDFSAEYRASLERKAQRAVATAKTTPEKIHAQTAENRRLADEAEARANKAVPPRVWKEAVDARVGAKKEFRAACDAFSQSPLDANLHALLDAARKLQSADEWVSVERDRRRAAREAAA